MEPPSFSTTGPQIIRAAPGSDASIVLPLPSGSPPFEFEWSRAGAKIDDRFKKTDDVGGVRLTISAARTGDSGVYTLQASNAAGKDTTRVRLEVSPDETPTGEDPPNFLRRLQDLTVKVGTRTRFLVEIVSSTECRVTWYRNERRLLEAERIALVRDGNFWCADISAVSVDDAGRWTCTAENVGGRASCSAHLNVLVPKAYKRPEFVEELRALLTEQGTVSLECKVVGVPTPVLRWFKDSREIKAGDVFALTANAEDPTSLGTYTCEAVNCMGRAYSSSKVHVVGRASRENLDRPSSGGITPEPPPIFTKELEDQFVRICEPLTLSCHIVVPPWPRNVVWYNKEGKIEPSERYHVLEDGVGGYLLEVPSAEWADEGEWKCVATSSGGRVGISTCYVSMDVPKNYRKPRFMENLQAVLTEEGLVSFECKVVGFPTPLLSWFKDGQELKPGDVYQLTGTNSLGSYCCIARNCMGQASSSAELTVEDIQNQLNEEEKLQLFSRNQAPKFLQGLKSVEAKIDEPFRFTIKVAIPPEPTVLWYRDDQPVDESCRCHHGKEERGVFFLDIQNLEFMDQAEWKCVAMNDYGHSVTSCFLKLIIPRHFKKPRFLENLQAILSDEGAVNLECKVIGVPQPVLKWYKDGEELKPGDIHRIISGQDGTCCLGTYTCEAQNCMGIAASSASLLGFEDSIKAKNKKKADEQALQRNLSLSTIHEERTSQMYDTPVGDMTLDEKGEISFSFDGKEVSVSLYETPDLTEEEALQIVEMYADQLSENVTEHNVVELPPLRFVKETSTSGNLLMEAIIIDVSPEYFTSPEEDLRTEADIEDISIADDNGPPQLSLDVDADGEDYLEKTIALLSDEKSDIPKKIDRKKSDSQRSADDYFSLSRDQSLSEEKKDDDTQILSESDLQSFASARSSGKPKSKSSKPSVEDGQESSDVTKTVLLREDLQNQTIEIDVSAIKHKTTRRSSQSSRRSSSGSEKSLSKMKEDMLEIKTESVVNLAKIDLNKEKVKTAMNGISVSLTEVINEIQILERDIILKSEFMSTAATASNSLEMINSLITPLSEIHSITDAIRETVEYSEKITSLLNNLPESLQNLQHSLTIISKCIDVESENKTLVTKTCMAIIKKCGQQLHNIIKDINTTVYNECQFDEKIRKSNIETITTDLISIINRTLDMVNSEENKKSERDGNVEEPTLESKHLHDTQKAIHDLRGSLRSLLFIIEEVDISKATSFLNIKKSEIILNDMSTPIQDLQSALEQIEILSVTESKSDLQKYNTEIIETAMESVLKLRTSFEKLSAEASNMEDKDVLSEVLNEIKFNIKKISIQLDELEAKTGKFDILNNDNKLEALQKMAQILINLENNLARLENISSVKYHMTELHKNLTKVLENVIESNDANKYFSLLEICDAVNRMNTSIKSIESNSELSLASINNTLKIIQTNISNNVFQPELNSSLMSSIANALVCIQETINKAEESSLNENLEDVKDLSIAKYEDSKVNVVLENIEQTIAAITNVISHESAKDMTLKKAIENVCPILVDLKYCIASLNFTSSDNNENLLDIENLSFSQSIANPLIELHQTISVINQVICENADSQDLSQLFTDYAKPLLDLCDTLEILQHDVVSQCIENEPHFDISSSIANVVENLKSCIVMIQEQPIIEGTDDMSTLDDISGIKTTADILSGDEFMTATVKENENVQFFERILPSESGKALQKLKYHITTLQNSDVLNVLEPVEFREKSSIKSFIIGLDEIRAQIESILHLITMESNQEQFRFMNLLKLIDIIPLLKDMQQILSDIDINTIPTKAETNPEKCFVVKENIQNFKSYLNYYLGILLPAVEITDNIVDVSTKIVSLRQSCEELSNVFSKLEECIESHKEIKTEISRLEKTVKLFLETTTYQNMAQIKCEIENLYKVVIIVQDELNQLASNKPELLSKENIFIQIIHDVEKYIVALEQCNFVNLCDLNIVEKEVVVAKSKVCEEFINEEDSLMIYLRELMTRLESICNQLLDKKKVLESEILQEKTYEKIEKIDLELSKGQLSNLNETIEKLEQYLNFGNMSVNGDDINMAIKLNYIVNDILSSIEHLKMSESMKTVYQSMELIKNILNQILSTEKDNEKQILLKGKAETLLQHMDHYIEIIEIVEEVSAVIKLEDLKKSANIVRELQQSLINTELTSENSIQNASNAKIKKEQAEIAQRLHKALESVQIQALESPRELAPTFDEDIRQQIIKVVSDLQNDLIVLAGKNVILEKSLIASAFESNIEDQEQNAKLVLEKQNQLKEIAKEEILVDTKKLIEYNELDNESELPQITDNNNDNTNNQLNLLNQLKEGEKDALNAGLNLDEPKPPERDETKSEKLTAINEILIKNINEYISENTLAIISKLSHPLHSEHLKKTVEIAEQLWNTILTETASSEKNELSNYSTKQIELILSLNEAILIMYQTTIEESQELENKVGKNKLQSFKNVVTNLRSILQEIINNIKSLPSVCDIDEFQQEETNIKELVEHIVPTGDKIISDSYQLEKIKDLDCNIANNDLLKDVIESLEERKNLLSNESDNYNQDNKVAIETEELYTENKDVTIIRSTIDQSIQYMEFDTELGKKKTSINKEELINHIREYFSEETVNVINKLSSLFKLEDIQQSVQIAHQLYDSLSSSESEIYYMSTQQLKLALLLEKTVSLLLESTVQETNELKLFAEKSELLKTNNVMNNLRNDLKMLIEITLIDTNLSTLDLDDLKVLITKEPFKYEIIVSNISVTTTSKETIPENISCMKQLDLPTSSVTETIDDSINYAVEAEITSVISDDKNLIQEKTVDVSPEDLKEKLQLEDFKDDNSIMKLESLLKEVNYMIDVSCDDNLEEIQNSLDEVQTIIMKMKSDFDGSIGDSINETLEDLECNVRSFQLQIIENSPQVLLKEACANLQTLVANISEINEVEEVLKPTTIKVANDVLDECSNDARQTIEFIEKVSYSGSTQHLEHIISNLNQIKDLIKSLRLKFLTNADTLIMGGVEIVQSLDQIEERIFCLEKDLESEKNVDPLTRDNIISAVHCVYGSISNMRGTISCVQKKYMYENYGKPSRYFLTSIKNVMELVKKEKNTKHWKQFAQSLRKVLNHFEDIKFYINFDKTARLPGDAAFTKIILGELVSVLSREVLQSVGSLDPEVIKNVYDCIKCINRKLSDIEHNTILEVKEKIPIFNDLSIKIMELTKIINKFMQNGMMTENDKNKIKSDLTPSQFTLEKENINEEEADENTKTDNIKDNANIELTQTLPEIIKEREENINGEVVVAKQGISQDVSTNYEIISEALKQKSENVNIFEHQVESEVLQSNKNQKIPTITDLEDKCIVQTEELLLEKDIFPQCDINLMEENNTDTIHAKEKKEIDLPETTCEKEVTQENQEKISDSDLLVKNHKMLQKTDDQKSSEIVSNDNNDKHDNQVDLENNNAEKQTQHQETKQVEEGKICDKSEKEVVSDVEEKKELLATKDYKENGSESKDQFKKFDSKEQDKQQKETMLSIEGKVEESVNTFVENAIMPKDKYTPQKKKPNEQSNKYDNGEEQNIANVEEKKEFVKSLENKENEESTGSGDQFKKYFEEHGQKHKETRLSMESTVQESLNTSVENAEMPYDMSTPHEIKPIKKSAICDHVIANVKEKKNTSKEDQFKTELKEQEQQQIENESTIESKVAESVNSSVGYMETPTEKSKSQERKQIVESTICGNGEKQVITNVEEKTEVIKESGTKENEESGSDKEDQFKNELKEQEQQQIENESTIESKVAESVNSSVGYMETPTEKSKSQERKQIVESTICDNGEKQVIANVEEKTEVIKESGTKEYEESGSDKEDQFKNELKEQEQQQMESISTIESKVAESVNTSVQNINMPIDKSKRQEMKQIVESTICDNDEKQVITNVEEKIEVIKELGTKEYGESSSGKEDHFKKELKEQEQQQIEIVSTFESKVAESSNTSVEHIDTPTEKSKIQEIKQVKESTIYDNDEKLEQFKERTICNNDESLEEKTEGIKESGTKEYGESSSGKEDQFKKELKKQEQEQIENESTIESKVAESVNTSVEHIDTPTEKSKPQEMKQVKESTICDNDEKQVITNVEERTEVIKESGTKEYGESSSGKEDQFKKELKEQEEQQIESASTIESKVAESVNTFVKHTDTPIDESKSQEMKQVKESTICDNDEKLEQFNESTICNNDENNEEKTEVIKESETKEYGESSSGKEDQFKKELNKQEQQQIENESTIESKVAESVNISVEHIETPTEKSKPQEMKQVKEGTICDNDENQVITNVEQKTEVIKESGTTEYGESSSGKEDQYKKELKEQEEQQIENESTIASKVAESVNTSVEHIDTPTEKPKPQEMKQVKESTICDNDEKQVITNVEERTEVIKESGTKEYGESCSDKEDQFKNELKEPQEMKQVKESTICDNDEKQVITNVEERTEVIKESGTKEYGESSSGKEDQFKKELKEQEEQQMESVSTIGSKVAESVNTSVEHIDTPTDKSKPQEMNQIVETTICGNEEKQIVANINDNKELIKIMEIKEYEESSTGEGDQYKKEYEEQKQQQKETFSIIESTVAKSLNASAENKKMPLEKSIIKNGNEKCKEEVTKVVEPFEEIANEKKKVAELQPREDNDLLNVEIKEDLVKEKAEIVTENKKHLVESSYQEKSSDNQECYTEKPIYKAMETSSDIIELEMQTEKGIDKILTKNDNFYAQIQEVTNYDESKVESKQKKCFIEKEDDTERIEVCKNLTYKDDSAEVQVSQQEITEIDDTKNDKNLDTVENINAININGKRKIVLEKDIDKQPSEVDEFTKKQDDLLYEENMESTNSNENIIQQDRIDILELSEPKQKENNQDVFKTKDNKSAIANTDIPVQLNIDDEIKEGTLSQIDNKTSTEHIDNGHRQKQNNKKKETKKKAETKKEEQNLIKEETKDSKLKKSLDAKQVGYSDLEEKMRENIRKTKVETITDLGEIYQEISSLTDSVRIEENAEIKIETDPFRHDINMRSDFSVKEIITQVASKSEDELKVSTHKLVENSNYLIEETCCKENENYINSERSEFKENIDQNIEKSSIIKECFEINLEKKTENVKNILDKVIDSDNQEHPINIIPDVSLETNHECKDKENLTENKKHKQICSKSQNIKLKKDFSKEQKEINDNKQESIKATQSKEVFKNQDCEIQSKTAIAKKEEAEINMDNKQESISLVNNDYESEVKILSDVDNQRDPNIIDMYHQVENLQIFKQSNENHKDNENNLSKEEISDLKKQDENIDKIINLAHLQVDKHTHILEQTQQVEAVFENVENSEKLLANTQEYSKEQEELKSKDQVQARFLMKEISEKEGTKSEKKQQKEKSRFKESPETSKQEAENEKSEVKPQETENNGLDERKKIDDMNLNVIIVALPSTKSEDANDICSKEDKQHQDKQENIEQQVQHNKLETKTDNKFLYEEESDNKKETDKLTRQINEMGIIKQNENKKEDILMKKEEDAKKLNRKERQDSDEENKIKHKINLEEKVIKDKNFEKIKDYDITKQLKDGTTSIKKDIREGQKSNEPRKANTIMADSILINFESEFSRPPGYVAKPYGVEDTVSQIQINNNKAQTIYKAQTLRHESQLRYSMPPHIDQALDPIEGRSQIKEKTKAASECRSTLSEKRCSSSRDIKRKPVFSTFLTDRTAVESSRVKLTCSVLTNTDPRITWYKNGVQLENKHKFRSKFVDGLITLEILNALRSDSGEYSCSVENENGLVTSSANLKVYPSFEASPIPPTFTRSIRDTYHLADNELVLECRIRGQPLPTITWLKNDKPIISERYQAHYLADGVCRLTISNPTTEDSGKYTCKAESSVWSDEITHDVYFTGKKSRASPNIATAEKLHFSRLGLESHRPHFTNVLSDHKVVTGGTIGLQVEIRGSPTRVEWLREGHSVTELYRNAQTYVDHDIYMLALSDVTEKESGLYTCRAYSNQGNVDMNASITVVQSNQYEGKPASIVSRPEKDVIISVGEDLNISFRVHGEPKAKVFFMKGIRDLSNSQRVCKMISDDYVKFTLKRTVVSDAGTYCIFAKNAYGCDRAFVTVVIRQRASSDNLISDWTYPMDDLVTSSLDRNYKSVPDRIPSEPSVVDGGNNWISLAWPKSDNQSRAPILAYKVESWLLGKEGGARWTELGITPRNSFDAFNLKQGEEYHFRVTPRNRYGWGESVQTSVPIGIGLAGDRPELVEILPGQLKVLVGEKAILRCSFTGKPMPEIVWMKNGHEIEEEIGRVVIQINNYQTSLRIEEVNIDDEGRYSCEATNIHGRSSTYARMAVITDRQIWQADAKLKRERSAGIDGEYPPQFTMRLRDRRVQATYPVRLTCQVVGNPSPVVKWFKNEEEVIIGGRYTASQDEYFYTLEIAPTTLEDGGIYEAMARNGCGAVSCRCSLVVDKGIRAYISPEFCCGLEPLYRLSEGEELRISAIVEAYPSVGVTWYRDGVRLRPSRRAIMTLDRDGQIELALASVTGRDAGVYTCTASNEVGMASTSGKVEILSGEYVIEKTSAPPIVISSDVPYSKEPMFIRKPRSSEAREGDTVIIECEVAGDPKPDVYWLRDFLKPDYYRDSSHFKRIGAGPAYRFEIPHAKLDYTGAYSIVAKNIHGETKAIISLQILAKDPTCGDDVHNIKYGRVEVIPRFDKELTDLLCYDGDAVEFECRLSGNPDPDIKWLHYNEIVPECPDFETSYDEGTARLKIKQVTAEDEGTYTCEASNSLGKASSSACLVVYPPGEPNTLSTRLRRPPALLSAASTPRSTPRTTPARSMSRTPGPEPRRLCSPSREIAPKFYTYPFNRVAEEGDTVVFQCAVKGLPQPWATWDKDGIIITPSARITIKEKDEMFRILEIEQVTIEDVGIYRISLENDYGRAEASARLEVITQKGKFYGSTRSFSVSPRKTLPYRRRTPSFSK